MLRRMFEGRMGRGRYIRNCLLAAVATFFAFVIIEGIAVAIYGVDIMENMVNQQLMILIFLVSEVVTLSFDVRRLHDLGKGGRWLILPVLPVVSGIMSVEFSSNVFTDVFNFFGFVLFLALAVLRGEKEDNAYGSPC
ncbi:DUF805 domain-containing protein [Anaerovibrio sp.]|uniref:DUF805 domain-containing protein n=1 Tax=Anaerovibrio sp. TaxID=1872532 RepID=UPI003F13EC08